MSAFDQTQWHRAHQDIIATLKAHVGLSGYERGFKARLCNQPRSNPFWIEMNQDFVDWFNGWDDADYAQRTTVSRIPQVEISRLA